MLYLSGDNCSVNKKLGLDLSINLVGCAAHRLNLAVLSYLGIYGSPYTHSHQQRRNAELLNKVGNTMDILWTIKGAAFLEKVTNKVALKPNKTRWTGNIEMVERFLEWEEDVLIES